MSMSFESAKTSLYVTICASAFTLSCTPSSARTRSSARVSCRRDGSRSDSSCGGSGGSSGGSGRDGGGSGRDGGSSGRRSSCCSFCCSFCCSSSSCTSSSSSSFSAFASAPARASAMACICRVGYVLSDCSCISLCADRWRRDGIEQIIEVIMFVILSILNHAATTPQPRLISCLCLLRVWCIATRSIQK